jgi:hypothetical protein
MLGDDVSSCNIKEARPRGEMTPGISTDDYRQANMEMEMLK